MSASRRTNPVASAQLALRRLRKWRRITSEVGPKRALFAYVYEGLDLDAWWAARERGLLGRAHELERNLASVSARLEVADARHHANAEAHAAALDGVRARLAWAEAELARTSAASDRLHDLLCATLWHESTAPARCPLVSVILPTRNRPTLVGRAIASVLAQTYANLELVVVDDARDGEASFDAQSYGDARIRVIRGRAIGLPAARNDGLDVARGELITYIDDDNFMFPGWVKAFVSTFEARPDVDFVYGARVLERAHEADPRRLHPTIQFDAFDRARLEQGNYIDAGVIAHRAGLADARFDEGLRAAEDWDLALSMTTLKDALALPVFASAYAMGAPDRISLDGTMTEACRTIIAKHAGRRARALAELRAAPNEDTADRA